MGGLWRPGLGTVPAGSESSDRRIGDRRSGMGGSGIGDWGSEDRGSEDRGSGIGGSGIRLLVAAPVAAEQRARPLRRSGSHGVGWLTASAPPPDLRAGCVRPPSRGPRLRWSLGGRSRRGSAGRRSRAQPRRGAGMEHTMALLAVDRWRAPLLRAKYVVAAEHRWRALALRRHRCSRLPPSSPTKPSAPTSWRCRSAAGCQPASSRVGWRGSRTRRSGRRDQWRSTSQRAVGARGRPGGTTLRSLACGSGFRRIGLRPMVRDRLRQCQ